MENTTLLLFQIVGMLVDEKIQKYRNRVAHWKDMMRMQESFDQYSIYSKNRYDFNFKQVEKWEPIVEIIDDILHIPTDKSTVECAVCGKEVSFLDVDIGRRCPKCQLIDR